MIQDRSSIIQQPSQKRSTLILPSMSFTLKQTPQNKSSKKLAIRPHSPRTQQACKQLGIDLDDFQIPNENDFGGQETDQSIKRMRYEHFMQRMQSDIQQILDERKEIIKQQRRRQIEQQTMNELSKSQGVGMGYTMNKSFSENHINPLSLSNVYNKAVSYYKSSHDKPGVKQGQEIFDDGDSDGAMELEDQLFLEIEKFNKLKQQKQKEARLIYEEEVKKLMMMKDMKVREEKLAQLEQKRRKEKEKERQQRKLDAQNKLELIKEKERQYRQRKADERKKMKQKLELLKQKQASEEEQRQQRKKEIEEQNIIRKEKLEQLRYKTREEELEKCMTTLQIIEEKQQKSLGNQTQIQQEKQHKLQEKQILEQQKFQQVFNQQQEREKQNLSQVVEKMVKKEQTFLKHREEQRKLEMEKRKEQKQKQMHLDDNKDKVKQEQKDKMRKLKDRFKKQEENLAKNKEQQQQKILIQQEERRLRQMDKLDNNERKKRKEEYRLQQIFEREQIHKQNIELRKQQMELLKKAKQEGSVQAKLESDRIFNGLSKVSDKLFPNSPDQLDTYLKPENKNKGVKILTSIFNKQEIENTLNIIDPPKLTEEEKAALKQKQK